MDGSAGKKRSYFKCGRVHPSCNSIRNCKFTTKEDGSEVNAQQEINEKFKEIKEMKKNQQKVIGTSHVIDGEIIPAWDDAMSDEEFHDSNLVETWTFAQDGAIDRCRKVVSFDIIQHYDHVCNQSIQNDKKDCNRKSQEILLDSQSTYNIIINKKLLTNIHCCEWTLRLQPQAGDCCVTQVSDVKGVGLVWHFPDGVANILSQFWMASIARWRITCDADLSHSTGRIKDLCCDVTVQEGFKCKFSPSQKGLHI